MPTNPYSAAKAGADMMAHAYHTSYRLPVITTPSNNVLAGVWQLGSWPRGA